MSEMYDQDQDGDFGSWRDFAVSRTLDDVIPIERRNVANIAAKAASNIVVGALALRVGYEAIRAGNNKSTTFTGKLLCIAAGVYAGHQAPALIGRGANQAVDCVSATRNNLFIREYGKLIESFPKDQV